jgi:cytochrome c-type biogenesis protein CcmH/NrfG
MAALGHELFSRGKIAEARVIFEGLAAEAADAFVFTMLGTIHLAQNELDKALARFEEALKLDPEDLAALVYRAEIRLQKKRVRQAIDDLQKAIGLGSSSEPFVDRARRLLQMARRAVKR